MPRRGLLIGKPDQMSSYVAHLFGQVPALRNFFDLLDASSSISEKADARPLDQVNGTVGERSCETDRRRKHLAKLPR